MTMTSYEVFCIYCQKEYRSPGRLRHHVLRIHPGTYRAIAFTKEVSLARAGGK